MPESLKLLLVEDNPDDARLIMHALRGTGYDSNWHRVDSEEAYLASLSDGWDIILSDWNMPKFGGHRALELLKASGLEIPFIIVSGAIGEETAVEAMKLGAADYLLKDRLGRLKTAISQAVEQSQLRRKIKLAEEQLQARSCELETVMSKAPVAILVSYDADCATITGNPAANALFRAKSAENISAAVEGIGFEIHRDGRRLRLDELPMQQCAATGIAMVDTELEIVFADGEKRYIFGSATPLFDEKGAIRGSIGTFIDITERKESEKALRNFNAELEARVKDRTLVLEQETARRQQLEEKILQINEREQNRLGQDLHDDLGQQLAGIGMLSEVLASQLHSELHPSAVDAARIQTLLSESITTTRDLAKSFYPVELERGGLILALQDLAVRTERLAKICCSVTGESHFHFQKSSEIHLFRIVQEAISNALKHGDAAKIEINCQAKDGVWTLTVTDDGSGFAPSEHLDGIGMGLNIFQFRARLIGAKIDVRKGNEGGCIVTCTLPASVGLGE